MRQYTITATIAITDPALIDRLTAADELHPIVLSYFGWTNQQIADELPCAPHTLHYYTAWINPYSKAKRKYPPPERVRRSVARIVRELVAKGDRPVSAIPVNLLTVAN